MRRLRWTSIIGAVVIMVFLASPAATAYQKLVPRVDNFIFLYDASGSMLMKYMSTGKHGEAGPRKIALAIRSMVITSMDIPELGYKAGLYEVAPGFKAHQEMAPYNTSAFIGKIKNLPTPKGIFGVTTPLAENLEKLDGVLSGLSGFTAVILFSDGDVNRGDTPAAVVKDLYEKHNVCFHVVSFAATEAEKKIIDSIASLNDCSLVFPGYKLKDRPALEKFIKQIFYKMVTVE